MWMLYAFASALFSGVMSVLAKIGINHTDSTLATALRTIVVAIFAWLMVFIVGSHTAISGINTKSLVFLIQSGLATGGSWLCYFRALQLGDVNKVVPVDKTSTVFYHTVVPDLAGRRYYLPENWRNASDRCRNVSDD